MLLIFKFFSQASPGNLQEFEEVLFGNNDMSASAVVMAVKLGTDSAGQKVYFYLSVAHMSCFRPE